MIQKQKKTEKAFLAKNSPKEKEIGYEKFKEER